VLAPCARLLAKVGVDGHGGTLTVRALDEVVIRPAGAKLGEDIGDVTVALWRRTATTGRRLVRSALALGGLRRETDRELAMPASVAVRDKLGELEATLATAVKKTDGKAKLPGPEIARLTAEHARLYERWHTALAGQAELRTAEDLCLEALAKDIDAVDLIDTAIESRRKFRRDLFWLVTSLRPVRPGATLLVHSPDARAAVAYWVKLVLAAAEHQRWHGSVHLWGETTPSWRHPWGPPHDLAWTTDQFGARPPAAALVRVQGNGADLLLGLEAGLHRFHGLAGEACHVWVDLLEPRTDFTDPREWLALPGPPSPRAARGNPVRELAIDGDELVVEGEELDLPARELAARLAESAIARLLPALTTPEGVEKLWLWERPLQAIEAQIAAEKEAAKP